MTTRYTNQQVADATLSYRQHTRPDAWQDTAVGRAMRAAAEAACTAQDGSHKPSR